VTGFTAEHRFTGEWFAHCDEILSYIDTQRIIPDLEP